MSIFSKRAVGLDIADFTIEVVEVEKSGATANVITKNRIEIPAGIVENGRPKDEKRLAEIITKLLKEAKPAPIKTSEIVFGLPDNLVYTYVFELEPHNPKEQEELVLAEAQRLIPLEEENLFYYYEAIELKKTGKTEIVFFGADREALLNWYNFFQGLKLDIKLLDLEALAVFRAIFAKSTKKPTAIIDWGSAGTRLYLFDENGLRESTLINLGGEKITLAIMNGLKLERPAAEEEKKKRGFKGQTKAAQIAKGLIDQVLVEIQESLVSFSEASGQKFSEIIIIGGTAQLPGLLENCQKFLGLPIKLGASPLLKNALPLEYLEALGLALRGTGRMLKEDEQMFDLSKVAKDARLLENFSEKKAAKSAKNFGAIASDEEVEEETEEAGGVAGDQARQLANLEKMNQQIQDKLHSQKIILFVILIIGVLAIGLAFGYRFYVVGKNAPAGPPILSQYSQNQTVEVSVPLAVEPSLYGVDKISGRIIEDYVMNKGDYDSITNASRNAVSKTLNIDEILAPEPINQEEILAATTTPITVSWAVYQQNSANSFFLQALDALNKNKEKYILSDIKVVKVEPTENSGIFNLKAEVKIYASKLINFSN